MIFTHYYVWLILISLSVLVLERVVPWRKGQKLLRKGIGQDLLWILINGHFFGILLAVVTGKLIVTINTFAFSIGMPLPDGTSPLDGLPVYGQLIVFILLKDFIEWVIHRLLHKVPFLWQFHKLHHSITTMDWIGNMRFHWMEIVVYKSIAYFPLVLFGIDWMLLLGVAIFQTLIGHLNHSNLPISWGPLKYILNSPKMHIWHHDVERHRGVGQNYGIVFSMWDWMFGTAYWPSDEDQPREIGLQEKDFPEGFFKRLFYPVTK